MRSLRGDASTPTLLHTANDVVEAREELRLWVDQLGVSESMLVLDSTPWVLPVGKICMEYGMSFNWDPFQAPTITLPGAHKIHFFLNKADCNGNSKFAR